MTVAIVTGSGGLIGSESARRLAALGYYVVGIDNDMRGVFFGSEASTRASYHRLESDLGASYVHYEADVRDRDGLGRIFDRYKTDVTVVIHTAAQPSHDWAARDPFVDFDVNAGGTLNLLQQTRCSSPGAAFVFTSTNKVYGDRPNSLPLHEEATRWEIGSGDPFESGITEEMPIDRTLHSVFGASKVAADVMVQEYGRYFGMSTVCFRGGTLTGPGHAATELHGFLGYVMRCAMSGTPYTIFGYKGKQVRDAIHSADLVSAFEAFWSAPRVAEVYNIGGGRHANVSVREAIDLAQEISGREMQVNYSDQSRVGDHQWWIGSNRRFEEHYPAWSQTYDIRTTLEEIHEANPGWTT